MPKNSHSRMLAESRRREILASIKKDGQITILEVVKRFSVSAVTARSDLEALTAGGAVIRRYGGAVRHEPTRDLRLKATLHRAEKVRIAHASARLVHSNEIIILDSGTTTTEIARQLKYAKLNSVTVITNALNIAMELADISGISVIMIGGLLRPVSYSFVGPQAEAMLSELHADRLFLAVDGFDVEMGPSTQDVLGAQLATCMIRVAREVNVVADSSKLGRRSVSRIGQNEKIHRLITDNKAPADFVEALRRKDIEVTLV